MSKLDKLNIAYEEFPDERIKVLTVSRGDEAINMFTGIQAEMIYGLLTELFESED